MAAKMCMHRFAARKEGTAWLHTKETHTFTTKGVRLQPLFVAPAQCSATLAPQAPHDSHNSFLESKGVTSIVSAVGRSLSSRTKANA